MSTGPAAPASGAGAPVPSRVYRLRGSSTLPIFAPGQQKAPRTHASRGLLPVVRHRPPMSGFRHAGDDAMAACRGRPVGHEVAASLPSVTDRVLVAPPCT